VDRNKHTGGQAGGRTEMTRPVVAFRNSEIFIFGLLFWPLERHAAEYLPVFILPYNQFL